MTPNWSLLTCRLFCKPRLAVYEPPSQKILADLSWIKWLNSRSTLHQNPQVPTGRATTLFSLSGLELTMWWVSWCYNSLTTLIFTLGKLVRMGNQMRIRSKKKLNWCPTDEHDTVRLPQSPDDSSGKPSTAILVLALLLVDICAAGYSLFHWCQVLLVPHGSTDRPNAALLSARKIRRLPTQEWHSEL